MTAKVESYRRPKDADESIPSVVFRLKKLNLDDEKDVAFYERLISGNNAIIHREHWVNSSLYIAYWEKAEGSTQDAGMTQREVDYPNPRQRLASMVIPRI